MDNNYLDYAYFEALKAMNKGEVPVGAVIVKNNKIISKAYNLKNKKNCSIYHAELIALKKASKKLKNWRLDDCDIYITLEPCPMCASAIKQSRIKNIYCGLNNSDIKNHNIIMEILKKDSTNNSVNFYSNLDSERIKKLMSDFFKNKRN